MIGSCSWWSRACAPASSERDGAAATKLEGVVEGHREMADAHSSSLDELRAQALSHRQAAVDHTRKAEEFEQRIEREERQATFHEQRAEQDPHASANSCNVGPI